MLFNTLKFAIFLVVALVVYRLIQRWKWPRLLWLLLTSYLFYASWDPRYLVLIVASTLLDWFVGQALARADGEDAATTRRRKRLLAASVVGNLAILGVFKYGNFALESVEGLLAMAGMQASLGRVPTELPVGISFYTFQTMSYTIDIYRRRMAPAKTFWDFALFVAFFPQLVAGPIVRASEFLPQLDRPPRIDARALGTGVFLILAGLVKKMVLADSIGARLVDPFFFHPELFSGAEMLISTWSFYFQVYLDFSGYTDIAMGAALLFGFTLPENFKRPALSRSPLEHWGRWHVTMMTWLRDYLYVPLGGSRLGRSRTLFNIVIVFI